MRGGVIPFFTGTKLPLVALFGITSTGCLVCKSKEHAAINCPKAKPLRTPPPEPPRTLDPAIIHKRRRTLRDV